MVQCVNGVRLPVLGSCSTPLVIDFVHQSRLQMEGSQSLKEGEAVEFTFNKFAKGLESI